MNQAISTSQAPPAIGPYSRAIRSGGWLFISGQIPWNPFTQELVEGDFDAQVRQVLLNLDAILRAAGATHASVTKVTVYLTDLAMFSRFNQLYQEFFQPPYPARSTLQVAGLPKGATIEVEAVAFLP